MYVCTYISNKNQESVCENLRNKLVACNLI